MGVYLEGKRKTLRNCLLLDSSQGAGLSNPFLAKRTAEEVNEILKNEEEGKESETKRQKQMRRARR